ncbi:MAG: hypothetical protein WA832_05405 [Bradyrhizobium sp.]|uniref:hypothetical protein n=1 Tax=Bradyrhizobium sp. TaxID=376 RepID=UPI003C7BA3DA
MADIDERGISCREMQKMRMSVDQPWQNGSAIQIPGLDRIFRLVPKLSLPANGYNPARLNQQRVSNRILVVETIDTRIVNECGRTRLIDGHGSCTQTS